MLFRSPKMAYSKAQKFYMSFSKNSGQDFLVKFFPTIKLIFKAADFWENIKTIWYLVAALISALVTLWTTRLKFIPIQIDFLIFIFSFCCLLWFFIGIFHVRQNIKTKDSKKITISFSKINAPNLVLAMGVISLALILHWSFRNGFFSLCTNMYKSSKVDQNLNEKNSVNLDHIEVHGSGNDGIKISGFKNVKVNHFVSNKNKGSGLNIVHSSNVTLENGKAGDNLKTGVNVEQDDK